MTNGARFSKELKPFGRISGETILFISSKRRRLEARNFEVVLIFIPSTTYEKNSFTEYADCSFTNGSLGLKSFRDFRERAPGHPSREGSVSPETALSSAELTRSVCCELADQMGKKI